jgi:hypothetical protein
MGGDELMYRVYHVETGEQLGGASSFDLLGDLYVALFFDNGIVPAQIRAERVRIVYEN